MVLDPVNVLLGKFLSELPTLVPLLLHIKIRGKVELLELLFVILFRVRLVENIVLLVPQVRAAEAVFTVMTHAKACRLPVPGFNHTAIENVLPLTALL